MAAPTARAASGAVQADWLDNQSLTGPPHQLHLDEPLLLDCGRALPEYVVNFETYGTLSAARDNAILVCHSLTSRAHAAGRHAPDDQRPGWWDAAIGPGKMLDTTRYFVICADALGAGQTTGPASPDPETGRRYGVRFPVITVRDMVRAQHRLVQRLGIDRLHAVIGGLMYLMRAVEYFDLEREYGDLEAAFRPVSARVMFVSYRRDWRYPAAEAERMRAAMAAAGGDARHLVLDSAMGHGAFLYDLGDLAARVSGFLGAPMR
jgi:homoserine acetyltransferase